MMKSSSSSPLIARACPVLLLVMGMLLTTPSSSISEDDLRRPEALGRPKVLILLGAGESGGLTDRLLPEENHVAGLGSVLMGLDAWFDLVPPGGMLSKVYRAESQA